MRRDHAIDLLSALKPSLRNQGIAHLYLFGSVARDEADQRSDVDVAFDVDPGEEMKFSLIDQSRITRQLAEALGSKVDFVERACLKPRTAKGFAADAVRVF